MELINFGSSWNGWRGIDVVDVIAAKTQGHVNAISLVGINRKPGLRLSNPSHRVNSELTLRKEGLPSHVRQPHPGLARR